MHLTKASATGNDFILIDLLDGAAFARDRAAFARAVCDRYDGIGADGAVYLEPSQTVDFKWDFINADGGRAEMCGNAARAVGLYVAEKLGRPKLSFETLSGVVTVEVHARDRVEVGLAPLGEVLAGEGYTFIRAGVPHAVITVPDARDWATLRTRALAIKARTEFKGAGVNVTFVRATAPRALEAVTFERGVEDFTRSCGTGAVAAAFASGAPEGEAVEVQVPGGRLTVVCRPERPVLIGPARLIARIDWLLD